MNKHLFEVLVEELAINNEHQIRDCVDEGLHCLWENIARADIVIADCRKATLETNDERCIDAQTILYNAISDLTCVAFDVVRGYFRPPGIVLRGVFEDVACVAAFLHDSDLWVKYKNDRFKSQDSVKIAKKNFPEIARWYGLTTQAYTHLEYATLGRSIGLQSNQRCRAMIVPFDERTASQVLLICLQASLAARFCGSMVELASLNGSPSFYYHKIDGKNLVEFRGTPEDKLIERLMSKLGTEIKEIDGIIG